MWRHLSVLLPLLRQVFPLVMLAGWHLNSHAVDRIEIHVGEIRHPAGVIENLDATLDMKGAWQGKAILKQADISQLTPNLPIKFSKGTLQGRMEFSGINTEIRQVKADITLRDIAFSDAEGLHAGEKIGGQFKLDASHAGDRWQWQTETIWRAGEVFWQPLYLPSGHSLKLSGTLQGDDLTVAQGQANMQDIGLVAFSATVNLADKRVRQLEVEARGLRAGRVYELLAKPFLEKSLLSNLEVAGTLDAHAQLGEQGVESFEVGLHDFDVEDKNGRFAFYKVNANIPWSIDKPTQAFFGFSGGKLLQLPLGATDLKAKLEGYSLTASSLQVPLLDGALTVHDVSAARVADRWHWHLRADLSPLGLPEFSHAMGWPHMDGKISAAIPLVTYSGGKLTTDGAMLFRAFDGTVKVSNLAMLDPLGLAPRLAADLEMRNLDMEMLTRTFSFGAMTGRLDGDVSGLELSSWQPVKFDASFRSSAGDYPKKISQRAVENISALGGAGAAAAIQRSFLRFFNEFNYQRIGLSCKLRNGVCQMDGVEPAQQGYVLVKGSGLPSITVLGYNRTVSWGELLERVQRITQGNAKPLIK